MYEADDFTPKQYYPPQRSSIASLIARLAPLFVVLVLTLFPFGWLGKEWPTFGSALNWAFATAREHAIGHSTIFFLLGVLTLATFPSLRARLGLYLGTMFLIGLGQELFQLLYKQRPLVFDDGRDLLTDLIGLIAAFGIVWMVQRFRRKATS
jgi:hypothetical protein